MRSKTTNGQRLNRTVAIKVLPLYTASDAASRKRLLREAQDALAQFLSDKVLLVKVDEFVELLARTFNSGNKVYSAGNGGSHCDAMHFAEELSGRFRNDRKALPAVSISDVSHLSCVANDYGYRYVFSRYIEALGKKGDVLLAISTSGW